MRSYAALMWVVLALTIPSPAVAESREAVTLQMRDGRPVVDGVFVNGHGPYRFLLDTGSTLNHLDPKIATSIGLAVTFHTKLTTATGTTAADGVERGDVRLGPATADRQVFPLAGIEGLHAISPDIQGVLGQVFLSRFDYRIDLRNRRLEFGKPEPDEKSGRVAFRTVEGRPVISTSLESLVLDSGAHYMVRFGVCTFQETHEMITASGAVNVGTLFSTLTIDGRRFWRGEAVVVPGSPESGADGLLPVNAFKSIYVSNSEGFVVFEQGR